MPVDFKHPTYEQHHKKWLRADACVEGSDAIKSSGDYLIRLSKETDEQYEERLNRTLYVNFAERVVGSLSGMLMRKNPHISAPGIDLSILDKFSESGHSIIKFISLIAMELVVKGGCGVLVDATESGESAYCCLYTVNQVINWRRSENGPDGGQFSLVVLEESHQEYRDEFSFFISTTWRVLDLTPDGLYRMRKFKRTADRGGFEQVGLDVFPHVLGKPLKFIPFVYFGDGKPPLDGLFDASIAHFNLIADYFLGLHFAGLPTPYITGEPDIEGKTFRVGGREAWVFDNPDTKVGYLSTEGRGLEEIRKALEYIEEKIVILGARMLEDQKRAPESARTEEVRRIGENSILSGISDELSTGITECLILFILFSGKTPPDDTIIRVNKDFISSQMEPQMLTALFQGWLSGAISKKVLAHNLVAGEIAPPGVSQDEIEAGIVDQEL